MYQINIVPILSNVDRVGIEILFVAYCLDVNESNKIRYK